MDADNDEQQLKLQRASSELIEELKQSLPRLLWKSSGKPSSISALFSPFPQCLFALAESAKLSRFGAKTRPQFKDEASH